VRPKSFRIGELNMEPEQTTPNPARSVPRPDSSDCELVEITGGFEDTTVRPAPESVRKRLESKPWLFQAFSTETESEVVEVTGGHVDTTVRPAPEHVRKALAKKPWLFEGPMPKPPQTPPENGNTGSES
jgi:hypothetical protein